MNVVTDITIAKAMALNALPLHEATELTQGGREARILLNGMVYSLRITRQGKLILTK